MKLKLLGILLVVSAGALHAQEYAPNLFTAVPELEWAPSGDKFVVRTGLEKLDILDEDGAVLHSLTGIISETAFSPDGSEIVYIRPLDGVYLRSLQTGEEIVIEDLSPSKDFARNLQWSPNGKTILYWASSQAVNGDGPLELRRFKKNTANPKAFERRNLLRFPGNRHE